VRERSRGTRGERAVVVEGHRGLALRRVAGGGTRKEGGRTDQMRKAIVALIVGLAMGYHWGFDEGSAGKPSVALRVLDKFGATKLKNAQEAQDKRVQEASKP